MIKLFVIAEISKHFPLLNNLPEEFLSAAGLGTISAIYLVLLLAGFLVNIIAVARWLAARSVQPARLMSWPRRLEELQSRSWTWRELGLIATLLLAAQLLINLSHQLMIKGLGAAKADILSMLVQGGGFHLIALAAIVCLLRRRGGSWAGAFGIRWQELPRRTGQGALWYLGILPLVFVTSLLYQLLLFLLGYPLSAQEIVLFFFQPQAPGTQILLLILALGIAPLVEEILFRGLALPLLARTLGAAPAILLTAAFFALAHFHLPSFAPLFVLAIGLAVAYIYTGSLWVPVVIHALFNGLNIGLLLLAAAR